MEFLTHDFAGLNSRFGRVTGTTFNTFPSYPQRYIEVLRDQAIEVEPGVRVERMEHPDLPKRYTAADLSVREFGKRASRKVRDRAVVRD